MSWTLLITIRFHDGRYHGSGHWPPAPARLFQALVAGAAWPCRQGEQSPAGEACGATLDTDKQHRALAWLELRDAPVILAPASQKGQRYINWVPNNDLDAVGGDPERVSKIRAAKTIVPRLFDKDLPLFYAWPFEDNEENRAHALTLCTLADSLYQLGRGVDMAWASAESVGTEEAEQRMEEHQKTHGGIIYRPSSGVTGGTVLDCPASGSLDSLINRYDAMGRRFSIRYKRRKPTKGNPAKKVVDGQGFTLPPPPRFRPVAYNSPSTYQLYDLRDSDPGKSEKFQPMPLTAIVTLVERVRDQAAARLKQALPAQTENIERVFGQLKEVNEADKAHRIRIMPLPSIGHEHANSSIRRVLLEVPPACPLRSDDIAWAFSGLHLGSDVHTGDIVDDNQPLLVVADDWRMADHYGIEKEASKKQEKQPSCLWRSWTPIALPERAARRRIDPLHQREQAKDGKERLQEEGNAIAAVERALRHAGITTAVTSIRVQPEPFYPKGARAEEFASGTRFSRHRLWHVEIRFTEPTFGPVMIGDGRYLGLGLMAPAKLEKTVKPVSP